MEDYSPKSRNKKIRTIIDARCMLTNFVNAVNLIHQDLLDIHLAIDTQNNLLDEIIHPHKALFNEENDCLCEFKKEESNKPCEM